MCNIKKSYITFFLYQGKFQPREKAAPENATFFVLNFVLCF